MTNAVTKLIAPSILSADFTRLAEEIAFVEPYSGLLHADVMDGHFVPNITIGPPVIKRLSAATRLPIDAHLMIEAPDLFLESFASAGAACLSVHQEVCPHLNRTVHRIKELGMKAGVALNPATGSETLEWILEELDFVLLMSVNPGFGGQSFLPLVLRKIEKTKTIIVKRGLSAAIEVDGGVSSETLPGLLSAGADWFVAGSAVFGSGAPALAARRLKELLDG